MFHSADTIGELKKKWQVQRRAKNDTQESNYWVLTVVPIEA